MTLDESIDGLTKYENNGIEAYIDAHLVEMLKDQGSINIDYVNQGGRQGYVVRVGDGCSSGNCESGGCG